jgi:AcrR family transcriptional regulator
MSKETRTLLLEAAERILIDQGVHALTVRRVGAVSGLNATLVTYHFGTMSKLLEELCRLNLEPITTDWVGLEDRVATVADAQKLETILRLWLQPLTLPAAFTHDGRALMVLDEIAAHGEAELSEALLHAMIEVGGRVQALLAPLLPALDARGLRARLRFIAGATLGPPPRTRSPDPVDGSEPMDGINYLIAFARASLLG